VGSEKNPGIGRRVGFKKRTVLARHIKVVLALLGRKSCIVLQDSSSCIRYPVEVFRVEAKITVKCQSHTRPPFLINKLVQIKELAH